MEELFSTEARRRPAVRGVPSMPMRGPRWNEPWPPPDRDPNDVAVVAARVLAASGRIETRLRRIARRHGVDANVTRFLLLFTELKGTLRIGNVADMLGVGHATASRIATRAHAAGLVDKFGSDLDRREVTVRLTVLGRDAVTRCLDALRADAADVLDIGRGATSHPRGAELVALLGRPPHHRMSRHFTGWRAGARIPMWPPV